MTRYVSIPDAIKFSLLMLVSLSLLFDVAHFIFPILQTEISNDSIGISIAMVGLVILLIYVFKVIDILTTFRPIENLTREIGLHKNLALFLFFSIDLYIIGTNSISIALPALGKLDITFLSWVFLYGILMWAFQVKPNFKLVWFCLAVIVFFSIGVFLILGFTHEAEYQANGGLTLNAHECNNLSNQFNTYTLQCKDMQGKMIAGRCAICTLNANATDIYGSFSLTHLNGSIDTVNFTDKVGFIIPESVGIIAVNISFKDNVNGWVNALGVRNVYFPTNSEYEQNKKDFVTYLIALLAFIVTAPPVLYKQYWELFGKLFEKTPINRKNSNNRKSTRRGLAKNQKSFNKNSKNKAKLRIQ
jgi:hypothetical protein